MALNIIFQILILIFSVIIHEVSHGFMALAFGDKTAQYQGRLTLNPLRHFDWFGSIILPIFLFVINAGFIIGWAKPVPYNPYNLKNRRVAEPLVALAGPFSNLIVAVVFGLLIRFLPISSSFSISLFWIFGQIVLINLGLAIFNLIPIPPLDGSKIIFSILPAGRFAFSESAAKYGLFVLIILIAFLPPVITPILSFLFRVITGLKLM